MTELDIGPEVRYEADLSVIGPIAFPENRYLQPVP